MKKMMCRVRPKGCKHWLPASFIAAAVRSYFWSVSPPQPLGALKRAVSATQTPAMAVRNGSPSPGCFEKPVFKLLSFARPDDGAKGASAARFRLVLKIDQAACGC